VNSSRTALREPSGILPVLVDAGSKGRNRCHWPAKSQMRGIDGDIEPCTQALTPGSAYRRKRPADLPLRVPATVGAATRKYLATVPLHRRQATIRPGAPAPAMYPYECRLPAGFTERDSIGVGKSGTLQHRVEGLNHWSSGAGDRAWRPDGPFLTSPGLLGPCARANREQTWGQNGHIKNDLKW
jgi:hypothetical protein